MKKVVITGASSFIGRHLTKEFLKKGWKVYGVIRKNSSGKEILQHFSGVIIVELDMKDYGKLTERVTESCDVFVSLAWNGTRGQERMDIQKQEYSYRHSMMALQEAIKLGCKTVVSAGSQAEYGPVNGIISEETPCAPNTEYGKWKLKFYEDGYRICRKEKITFIEPRFFSLYGEDDCKDTMVISILQNMLDNKVCKLTECIQKWDFLYVDDAVKGLVSLIELGAESGVYNFASGDVRILKDFVMEMYHITGSGSKLLFGVIPYPPTGMVSIFPDVRKLQKSIEWKPQMSFADGVRKILEYVC